jgi:Hydantoinase/oxoprolinase N-terminal region
MRLRKVSVGSSRLLQVPQFREVKSSTQARLVHGIVHGHINFSEFRSAYYIRVSTTVAKNVLLERKGHRQALIITKGFKVNRRSHICCARLTQPTGSPSHRGSVVMWPPSPAIPERDFALYALEQSLRLHGRSTLEMRAAFQFGPKQGRVECALGKTRCVNFAFFKYTSI